MRWRGVRMCGREWRRGMVELVGWTVILQQWSLTKVQQQQRNEWQDDSGSRKSQEKSKETTETLTMSISKSSVEDAHYS